MVTNTTARQSARRGTDAVSLVEQLSLWPHQKEAVARMRSYIFKFRQGETKGSALVHMPTGSGKTGVIATLARCIGDTGCVLVLTPRVALREQLVRDIGGRFFERLASAPDVSQIPKRVIALDGGSRQLSSDNIDQTVFVATVQKLRAMSRRASAQLAELSEHVSLVMFDEGHYEPAPMWSQAVRQLRAPKVIFTATPYRNDLKVFDLDPEHAYSYTYQEAVAERYLREVEFIPRTPTRDPERFVDDVLNFCDEQFGANPDAPRVIIRCDDRTEIRQIAAVLEHHARSYVAIHERFSDVAGNPRERKTVPDPAVEGARFWIHQFKLLEGIDDPRFQVLALFEPLLSARPLVQQVGRIIRNPAQQPSMKGYVLDHHAGLQEELWEGFLRYDAAIAERGDEGLNLAVGHGWVTSLLGALPGAAYLDGRFRIPLDVNTLVPSEEIVLPLRVNLLCKLDGFQLDRLCDILEQDYTSQDRLVKRHDHDDNTVVFVYFTFTHSPYLTNASFFEPRLGLTVVHELDDMIAFYDTHGYVPLNYDRARLGKAVDSRKLKKLFRQHPGSHLTSVSLRNTTLGTRAVRSRSLSAAAVAHTVSAFDDHSQVCTTVRGYSIDEPGAPGDKTRRYVGFHTGRISQSSGQWCSLDEYLDWLHDIQATVQRSTRYVPTFRRYAPEHVDVGDPTPVHILLDVFEVEDTYVTLPGRGAPRGKPLQIEDLSCEVQNGHFSIVANGVECRVGLEYDDVKRRYHLDSPDLDSLYKNTTPFHDRGIVNYLNREQSFRIIPKSTNVIYALGQFYRPVFKVGRSFDRRDFEVSKILFTCPALEGVRSEKGDSFPSDRSGWEAGSLFGIIDDLGVSADLHPYFGDPDILLCDDMCTEVADFILADTRHNRVVFIHAQASRDRRPYSATALQKVCGQVTKNINYLGMFNEQTPRNVARWEGAWPSDKDPKVQRRIRLGAGPGGDIWSSVQSVIRHPLADRQVWLFLGRILCKNEFEDHLARTNPTAEAVQAAFLLHATMTSVASVGATLHIFCCP